MLRPRLNWAIAPLVLLLGGSIARADGIFDLLIAQSANAPRGPGLYLNLFKFLPVVAIYVLWTWTTNWIEKDGEGLNNPRFQMWNSIAFFSRAARVPAPVPDPDLLCRRAAAGRRVARTIDCLYLGS